MKRFKISYDDRAAALIALQNAKNEDISENDDAEEEAIQEEIIDHELRRERRNKRFETLKENRAQKRKATRLRDEIRIEEAEKLETKIKREFFFAPGEFVLDKRNATTDNPLGGLILEVHDRVLSTYNCGMPKEIEKGVYLSVLVNGAVETWYSDRVRYSRDD